MQLLGTRLQSGIIPIPDPRFAGDRGSIPTAIPDLPGMGDGGSIPAAIPDLPGIGDHLGIIPIPGSHRVFRALATSTPGQARGPPLPGGDADEFREKRLRPWLHVARVKRPTSTGPRPKRPGPW